MSKTREREEFIHVMTQECGNTPDLLALLRRLMRLSAQHARLQEKACNEEVPEGHDAPCERLITAVCGQLGCTPVFSGDPRGCTVKLKMPSGRTNDFGGTGVCVPQ